MSVILLRDQPALVTIDDFLGTYKDPDHYQATSALEFLKEKDLLPLTYDSPFFPTLNILVAATLWSGSISRGSLDRPHLNLSLDDVAFQSVDRAIEDLGLTMHRKPSRDNSVCLGTNGGAYARLVSQIPGIFYSEGDHKNPDRKAYRDVTLPDYIEFLTRRYGSIHNNDKKITQKVLRDFLAVLMQTRLRKKDRASLSFNLDFFHSASEGTATIVPLQVVKMFQRVYPSIGLTEQDCQVKSDAKCSEGQYVGILSWKKEHTLRALEHYDIFHLRLNRQFWTLGRRSSYREHKEL